MGTAASSSPGSSTRTTRGTAAATKRTPGGTRVGGVLVSHPGRVIDPTSRTTKLALVRWYELAAPRMLPHLKGRPVALVRAPSGITGPLFFQRHDDRRAPDAPVEIASARALLQAAQLNAIEFHTESDRFTTRDKPDRVVFDLDPGEGVEFARVREGALRVRELLARLELKAWLKTSGGKGLHVVVPIVARWHADVVRAFARAVVEHLARAEPGEFVAKSGPANRIGRIFVDYLRNGTDSTTVAAFSARARPGLGVSMPVDWADLPGLSSGAHFTVANAPEHLRWLDAAPDPWAGYAQARQSLTAPMRHLGLRAPARRVP
jgi:bifunctional non-homologous end joining protein LigD